MHILMSCNTADSPAELVRELKKASSIWVSENHERPFAWQEGYAIFSVSWAHWPALRRYIEGQEEHHRQLPFEEELKRLLAKNGVTYDPKYLL